ncbi:MAG TPA: hypothetical protein VNG33_01260 [Polyangiaceae bacterium]|nr:hypothetical protein [Polyangiaceae bacterium]
MENLKRSVWVYAALGARWAGAATLALCLVQCGVEQPSASAGDENVSQVKESVSGEHCGGIACTGITQCQSNAPLCAVAASATCLTDAPRVCAWQLNISSSCPCLEHDVRLCAVSGNAGVQICMANGTSTYWSSCQTTPLCTP